MSTDMRSTQLRDLRVILLAGSLGQGGAEKQLVYIARALREAEANVKILSITRGEYYESILLEEGFFPRWIGCFSNPLIRLVVATYAAWKFYPHIYQSCHFFTNLYVSLFSRIAPGSVSVGSIRGDTNHALEANKIWGRGLLRAPHVLIANSYAARENAIALGVKERRLHVLPNVIDLGEFAQKASRPLDIIPDRDAIIAIAVARLVRVKRLDRFLRALVLARQHIPNLVGWIVGDGPERASLEELAAELRLLPDGVRFWGQRDDIPTLLSNCHMLVLTSDREGFPNVILEAMAASLPVIATPAGDTAQVVGEEVTGYVVSGDPVEKIADRLVHLARNPDLRATLGSAGRCRVEQQYSYRSLPQTLEQLYQNILADHARLYRC